MEIDIQTLNFIFNIELNEFKNKVTSDLELRNKIKNVQKNICHPQNPIYGSKFIASLNDFELIKLIKALTLFDSINSLVRIPETLGH